MYSIYRSGGISKWYIRNARARFMYLCNRWDYLFPKQAQIGIFLLLMRLVSRLWIIKVGFSFLWKNIILCISSMLKFLNLIWCHLRSRTISLVSLKTTSLWGWCMNGNGKAQLNSLQINSLGLGLSIGSIVITFIPQECSLTSSFLANWGHCWV